MPELPEVETVRRGLQPVMEGARIIKLDARRPDLRRPLPKDFARRVEGETVLGIGRRAKYLTVDLSSGDVLLMHLGMSGSFRVGHEDTAATPGVFHHPRSAAAAHDHVVFHLSSGATVTFNDPRRFGLMLLVPRAELAAHPLMREIGPEPLGNAFDAALLAQGCAGRKTSLKAALLDQTVVAGLGNIYVCEALHRRTCRRNAAPRPSRPAARRTRGRRRWSTPSRRCSMRRSRPAARRCATIARPTASSATSSIISASTTARANPAPPRAAKGR